MFMRNSWVNEKGPYMYVAVYVFMMRGEFDDRLKWPLKGEIKVQLLNQRGRGTCDQM